MEKIASNNLESHKFPRSNLPKIAIHNPADPAMAEADREPFRVEIQANEWREINAFPAGLVEAAGASSRWDFFFNSSPCILSYQAGKGISASTPSTVALAGTSSSYDEEACSLTTTFPKTCSSRRSNALSKVPKNNGRNPRDRSPSCGTQCVR